MLTETQRAKIAEIREELKRKQEIASCPNPVSSTMKDYIDHVDFMLNLCAELTQKLNRLEGGK